jgi:YD repeat-containing protein
MIARPLAVIDDGVGRIPFTWDDAAKVFRSPSGGQLSLADGKAVRTKPDGATETFDAQGRLVERDERNGDKIRLEYDPQGRLAKVIGPFNTFLTFAISPEGRLRQVEGSNSERIQYSYGEATPTSNDAFVVTYGYSADGNLTRISQSPSGSIDIAYDGAGRVTSRRWADGANEKREYSNDNRTVRCTDASGGTTTTQWSADDRAVETIDPLGRKSVIENDAQGRPVKLTGPTGQTVQFSYDELGRTVTIDNSAIGKTQITYRGTSKLVAGISQPDGQNRTFQYD